MSIESPADWTSEPVAIETFSLPPSVVAEVRRFAAESPAAIAVSDRAMTLRYDELMAWADRTAAILRDQYGIKDGERVGVLCAQGVPAVAALLGVLAAGGCALTLHPEQPDAALSDVLADAGVRLVLSDLPAREIEGIRFLPAGSPPAAVQGAADPVEPGPGDPAYVVYTSGSTGAPKGVLVSHGQLAWSTMARRQVYPGRAVFLLLSPFAFDSAMAGTWGTLTTGGHLVVAAMDEIRDPEAVLDLVARHGATRSLCVPSLYRQLLDAAQRRGPAALDSLRVTTVAGETLPDALIEQHFAVLPEVALVNEYGPSETTIWATYRSYDAPAPASIGDAVPGATLYVVDDELRPVPDGEPGELLVGGPGVAIGYLGRAEETSARFLDNPWGRGEGRVYRTGDLVRRDGEQLSFLGRRDRQVKIRGHRVELEAVEVAIRRVPGVSEVAVVTEQDRASLVAHLVLTDGTSVDQVRALVGRRLGPGQQPTRYVIHDELPVNANGKTDHLALAAVPAPTARVGQDMAKQIDQHVPNPAKGADHDVADQVEAAWSEILGYGPIPRTANFFDVGGHSLTMVRLQEVLERHTGTRVPVVSLFRHTTVADQAALIVGDADAAGTQPAASADRRQRALDARRRRLNRSAE